MAFPHHHRCDIRGSNPANGRISHYRHRGPTLFQPDLRDPSRIHGQFSHYRHHCPTPFLPDQRDLSHIHGRISHYRHAVQPLSIRSQDPRCIRSPTRPSRSNPLSARSAISETHPWPDLSLPSSRSNPLTTIYELHLAILLVDGYYIWQSFGFWGGDESGEMAARPDHGLPPLPKQSC